MPIRAVVGGLHLPVLSAGTPLVPQAIIGNPLPPWRPIGERDAEHVLEEVQARGPRLIALFGQDSTSWTFDAFTRRFGDRYRTLRPGRNCGLPPRAPESPYRRPASPAVTSRRVTWQQWRCPPSPALIALAWLAGAVVAASLLFRRSMRTGRHREAQERTVTASACWLRRGGAPRLPRSVLSEW